MWDSSNYHGGDRMWENSSDQIYVCTSTTSRGYCGKYDPYEGIILWYKDWIGVIQKCYNFENSIFLTVDGISTKHWIMFYKFEWQARHLIHFN